jgi:hypothetical protein
MCGRNGFSHLAAEVAGGASYIACSVGSGDGTVGTDNDYSDGIFFGGNGES